MQLKSFSGIAIFYIFFSIDFRYFNLQTDYEKQTCPKCNKSVEIIGVGRWKKESIGGRSTYLPSDKILRIYRNIYMVARKSCSNSFLHRYSEFSGVTIYILRIYM